MPNLGELAEVLNNMDRLYMLAIICACFVARHGRIKYI